jgi:GTP cyclohydrolase II
MYKTRLVFRSAFIYVGAGAPGLADSFLTAKRAKILGMPSTPPAIHLGATPLPTDYGEFTWHAFRTRAGEHLVLTMGDVAQDDVLVRVHSECVTGDIARSHRCDCGPQLDHAFHQIAYEKRGVVIVMRGHEGRGHGHLAKNRLYQQIDQGYTNHEAPTRLGLPYDIRTYDDAVSILRALGVKSVRLLTNSPDKIAAIGHGLSEVGVPVRAVASMPTVAMESISYLADKAAHGHVNLLGGLFQAAGSRVETPSPTVRTMLLSACRQFEQQSYNEFAGALLAAWERCGVESTHRDLNPERLSNGLQSVVDELLGGVGVAAERPTHQGKLSLAKRAYATMAETFARDEFHVPSFDELSRASQRNWLGAVTRMVDAEIGLNRNLQAQSGIAYFTATQPAFR